MGLVFGLSPSYEALNRTTVSDAVQKIYKKKGRQKHDAIPQKPGRFLGLPDYPRLSTTRDVPRCRENDFFMTKL